MEGSGWVETLYAGMQKQGAPNSPKTVGFPDKKAPNKVPRVETQAA